MRSKHANRLWHGTIKSFGATSSTVGLWGRPTEVRLPSLQDHGGTCLPAPGVMTE